MVLAIGSFIQDFGGQLSVCSGKRISLFKGTVTSIVSKIQDFKADFTPTETHKYPGQVLIKITMPV